MKNNVEKKTSGKGKIIKGIVFTVLGLIFLSEWGAINQCQQPLLPFQPKKVPSQITGIKRRLLYTRQLSMRAIMPIRWARQANLPKLVDNITGSVMDIGVQGRNVWLIRPGLLQKYSLEENVLANYELTDEGEVITWIRYMHIMDDGTAWFLVRTDRGYYFTKYDEELDTLKTIHDQNDLFSSWEDAEIDNFSIDSNMSETDFGELLISFRNNIIAYSPDTNIARLLLPESFDHKIRSVAQSEGVVWFTVEKPKGLWSFNSLTNELTNYGNEFNLEWHEDIPPISVDGMERVWVGYKSRLDPVGNGEYEWWEPESYPLEFLILADNNLDSLSGYDAFWLEWANVKAVKATSDGNVWFSSSAGIVYYDIYEDKWCLSAPEYPRDFEEDDEGFLWIGIGHHWSFHRGIYKYNLGLLDH